MYRRIKLFSIASLVLAVCVASMGGLTPSAMALGMDVQQPSYELFKGDYAPQILPVPMDKYALEPRTVSFTYLEIEKTPHRFDFVSDQRNIAINHFVKGGGVTYIHGGKSVSTS